MYFPVIPQSCPACQIWRVDCFSDFSAMGRKFEALDLECFLFRLLAYQRVRYPGEPTSSWKREYIEVLCSSYKVLITSKSEEFFGLKSRMSDRLSVRICMRLKFQEMSQLGSIAGSPAPKQETLNLLPKCFIVSLQYLLYILCHVSLVIFSTLLKICNYCFTVTPTLLQNITILSNDNAP